MAKIDSQIVLLSAASVPLWYKALRVYVRENMPFLRKIKRMFRMRKLNASLSDRKQKAFELKMEHNPCGYDIEMFAKHGDRDLMAKRVAEQIVSMLALQDHPRMVLHRLTNMGLGKQNPFAAQTPQHRMYNLIVAKTWENMCLPDANVDISAWKKKYSNVPSSVWYDINSKTFVKLPLSVKEPVIERSETSEIVSKK